MDDLLIRIVIVAAIVLAAAVLGLWLRTRDGRLRAVTRGSTSGGVEFTERVDAGQLEAVGLDLGGIGVGAVLVGSATCAPCETAKDVLDEFSRARDGFGWVYADAAQHRELTHQFRILKVPTLLLLDADGQVIARSSGVPRVADLHRALDENLGLAA